MRQISFSTFLAQKFINELWPAECANCGKEANWLCTACTLESYAIKAPTCPFCDRLSPLGKACPKCKRTHKLTGNRALWYYKGPVVELIHKYKYNRVAAASEWVTPQLEKLFNELPLAIDSKLIITSVPSNPERLAKRGYNQSEIIAQALATAHNLPYLPLLMRTNAQSQTQLSRKERIASVQNQYSLIGKRDIAGCHIVIVDDVITTGATLNICATLLKSAGAKQVWGLTIAKD